MLRSEAFQPSASHLRRDRPSPGSELSWHCPAFSAGLQSKESSSIMFRNRKLISFLKQAAEKHLKGICYMGRFCFHCCAMAENHICTELVLHVSITGSGGQPLWGTGGTNQKLSLINKAPGFQKRRICARLSTGACPTVEIRTAKLGDRQLSKAKELFPPPRIRHLLCHGSRRVFKTSSSSSEAPSGMFSA